MPSLHLPLRELLISRDGGFLLDGDTIVAASSGIEDQEHSGSGNEGSHQSPFHSPDTPVSVQADPTDVPSSDLPASTVTSTSSSMAQSTSASETQSQLQTSQTTTLTSSMSPTPSTSSTTSSPTTTTSIPSSSSNIISTSESSYVNPSSSTAVASATNTSLPDPHIQNASAHHTVSFWTGITCGGIAVAVIFFTLLCFWRRVRSPRGRKRDEWMPPSPAGSSGDWWAPAFSRNADDSRFDRSSLAAKRPSFLRRFYTGIRDPQPRPVSVIAPRSITHSMSSFGDGPYPTVRASSQSSAESEDGNLVVANFADGDIMSSGDEGGRTSTVGTPREQQMEMRPRYLGLRDGGLVVPWAAPAPPPLVLQPARQEEGNKWRSRLRDYPPRNIQANDQTAIAAPAFPQPSIPQGQGPAEGNGWGWTNALRTNIAAAFNTFAGTAASQNGAPTSSRPTSRSNSLFGPRRQPLSRGSSHKQSSLESSRTGAVFTNIELTPTKSGSNTTGSGDYFSVSRSSSHCPNPFDTPSSSKTSAGADLVRLPPPALSKEDYVSLSRSSSHCSGPRRMPRNRGSTPFALSFKFFLGQVPFPLFAAGLFIHGFWSSILHPSFISVIPSLSLRNPSAVTLYHRTSTMFFSKSFVALVALASPLVAPTLAHGTITAIAGANGVNSQGFGIIASTPRDGSTPKPFEQDTSVIRDNEIDSGKTDVCGRTKAGGNNDVATQLAAVATSGLPTPAANGSVSMTLHQVNGDGAGPYTCECSADGTGADFVNMEVTTNVPGTKSRSKAKATDFALVAQMPTGVNCTGGPNGDACLVRCRNDAAAGPFGSCVAVGNADSGNTTTSTGTTGSNSTTTGTTDTGAAGTNSTATDSSANSSASTSASTGTTESSTGGNTTDSSISNPAVSSSAADATVSVAAATVGSKAAKAKATAKAPVKRYIRSRVVGKRAGQWIDI